MFAKKVFCSLLLLICFLSVFLVNVSAARTGEFEAYSIEFKALTPDDLVEPVEIQLTHLTEKYVLKYYLYDINNYFSNELIPPGEYSVNVSVGNVEQSNFNFIYEKRLYVEPSSVAVSFTVVVDNASLEGDAYGGETTNETEDSVDISENKEEEALDAESNEVEENIEQGKNASGLNKNGEPEHSSGGGSLLVSFLFSAFLIIVCAIGLWLWNKIR